MAKPTWITVNPNQGSGSASVAITAAASTEGYRTGSVNIVAPGFPDTAVEVEQYPGDCQRVLAFRANSNPLSSYVAVSSFDVRQAQAQIGDGGFQSWTLVNPAAFVTNDPKDTHWTLLVSEAYIGVDRGNIILNFTYSQPFSGTAASLYAKVKKVQLVSTNNGSIGTSDTLSAYGISAYNSFINGINTEVSSDEFLLIMRVKGVNSKLASDFRALITKPKFNLIIYDDLTTRSNSFGLSMFAFASGRGNSDDGYDAYQVSTSFNDSEATAFLGRGGDTQDHIVDISEFQSFQYSTFSPYSIFAKWNGLPYSRTITITTETFGWVNLSSSGTFVKLFCLNVYALNITSKKIQSPFDVSVIPYDQNCSTFISEINSQMAVLPTLEFELSLDLKDMTAAAKTRLMALKTAPNFTLNITVRS